MRGRYKVTFVLLSLMSILLSFQICQGATITYTYDKLNRITKVNYGNGIIEDYSYEAAGNRLTLIVTGSDSTPPDTSITSGPSGIITTNNVSFTFTGTDNLTGTADLVYSTYLQGYDSGWSIFSSFTTKSYSNLANGSYVFHVKAGDQAGNEDPSSDTRSFTINVIVPDTTPPETSVTSGPSGIITTNTASFSFTGSDNVTLVANLVYATYLQGYDSSWSNFSISTTMSYSNLPNGSYTFQVKAKDQAGNEDPTPGEKSFTISYDPLNTSPVAIDQSVTTNKNTPTAITLTATDDEGDTLAFSIDSYPFHGTLSGTLPNVTYTPASNYTGSDSFSFKVNDGQADSNIAIVYITVNAPPIAINQSVMTSQNTPKAITLTGTDTDGDILTYSIVTPPSHGELSGTPPNVIYTPTLDYTGSDSFTFKLNDGKVDSSIAIISINYIQFPKGDINNDGSVNLQDAIIALQVLSGLSPSGISPHYIYSGADVNGDNKIGIEEVIFILQIVADFRRSTEQSKTPDVPALLSQFKSDGETPIIPGSTIDFRTVILRANLNDLNGDQVKLQIELRSSQENFTGVATHESVFVNSGQSATITITNLVNGEYKWRARAVDSKGAASTWVDAGLSGTDFVVMVSLDLDAGLVAYYPFKSNANDMSGNGNHGTVFGATLTRDMVGNANNAFSFDGVDDYIEIPYTPNLDFGTNDFAISVWFYARELGDKSIVSRWAAGNWAWDLRIGWPSGGGEADKIYFGFGSDSSNLIKISDTVSVNEWHHIVVTRRGENLYGYLDVVEFDAGVHSGNATGNSTMRLGSFPGYGTGQLNGFLDEVRLYNRALTKAEIQELYVKYASTAAIWTPKSPMPTKRLGSTSSVVEGKIYVFGGLDSNGCSSSVEEYDPITDSWSIKTPMPTPRQWLGSASVNGKIYVAGGHNCIRSIFDNLEEYNPATDTWTAKTSMPTARINPTISVINGKIYAIGGRYVERIESDANEEYDPSTDSWTIRVPMPTARQGATASVVNDKIYVIGGYSAQCGNCALNTVEEYDPVMDKWTTKTELPINLHSGANWSSAVGDKIYVILGPYNFEYDPAVDTWTEKTPTPTASRDALACSVVDEKIYVIGGGERDQSGNLILHDTNEEYDPAAD